MGTTNCLTLGGYTESPNEVRGQPTSITSGDARRYASLREDIMLGATVLTGSDTTSGLTIDQKKVLSLIIWYKRGNDGNAPSYTHLQREGCFPSTNTVFVIVTKLVAMGYLYKTFNGKLCVRGGEWDTSLQLDST